MRELKLKRLTAGISGSVLCAKAGISRSRLSLIERGFVSPGPEEAGRIDEALRHLIETKSVIDHVAASMGWPTGGHRDQ
jgi:transcriptional regulator with XRE-family HTH domain